MSTIRIGTTKKYSDNWDAIFGGKRRGKASTATVAVKKGSKAATKKKKAAPKKKVAAKKGKRK